MCAPVFFPHFCIQVLARLPNAELHSKAWEPQISQIPQIHHVPASRMEFKWPGDGPALCVTYAGSPEFAGWSVSTEKSKIGVNL